jgi:centractin
MHLQKLVTSHLEMFASAGKTVDRTSNSEASKNGRWWVGIKQSVSHDLPLCFSPDPLGSTRPFGPRTRQRSTSMSTEFDDVLTNQPVVIDNGSGTIKAGFSGQDTPKCFFPSFVGRPKHVRVMAGALEGDVFIGRKAQEFRGLLKIKYPMEHGIVTDWDDMERIWNWIYAEELGTLSEEHPVLLTEAPLNPRTNRETAAQIFFDTFNVPALFTSVQAVLSLYASGRTTGIVLDSGDGVSHAVPVFEGFSVPHAIRRIDIAGRDVTDYLQLLLRKSGHHLHTTAEREVVRTIKEKCCYVAADPRKEEKDMIASGNKGEDFRLPDGHVIKLGTEKFKAPEILFNPEIIGQEYSGVQQVIIESISRTDMDLRKSLYSNIVLSGGSTLCKGFGDRLLGEVKKLSLKDIKIKIYAPPERKYSTWIGGSILAGLTTFKKVNLTFFSVHVLGVHFIP